MRQLTVMATATRPVGAEQPWARWPDHCKATNPRQRGSARDGWHDPAERHGMRWQNVLARDGETDSSRPCEGCKRRVQRSTKEYRAPPPLQDHGACEHERNGANQPDIGELFMVFRP